MRVLYFHNDVNGAPEKLTDIQGEILWNVSYQVWGNTFRETYQPIEITRQNIRFQGQYLDRETGLHYNTFRYYDPDVGRFTTTDPISLAGGLNLYQYAPNPLMWIDPWGWCSSARTRTVGRTPGKGSVTGKAVIARMRAEGKIIGKDANMKFWGKDKNGKAGWYDIKLADMGHTKDAVTYWNSRGKFFGPKSKEVRAWMKDPNNYELQHRGANRSAGAKLG